MKPEKLDRIATNRATVARYLADAHVQGCPCCQQTLRLVNEDPGLTFANALLRLVRLRLVSPPRGDS